MADAAPAAPVPGTPEYDAAMAQLADDRGAAALKAGTPGDLPSGPPAVPQRPADVPEKFWDAAKGVINQEALLKSYRELETRVGQQPAPAAPKPPASNDQAPADTKGAEEAAKAAGVDLEGLEAEYVSSGALSEASLKALADKGITKEQVDAYIEGRRAVAAKQIEAGQQLVGGAEKYNEIVSWAAGALSGQEKIAYNKAVNDKDPSVRELAILGLQAKFVKANGTNPEAFVGAGKGNGSGGVQGFASRAEMTAAINDPRFNTDPAYRAQVERRIGAMP